MQRIAVLADIHGNVPALEAVLADLREVAPDEVLVGGDLVGRGPEGSAVCGIVRERGWRSIRGNHEDYLIALRRGERPRDWTESDEWSAARWMAAELTDADVAFIAALPLGLGAATAPALRLVHGTPASNSEGLGPWTADEELERHLAQIDTGLLVCAHTHRPMDRQLPGGRVVNVGAVGLPFNRDQRAQYAVVQLADGRTEVDFRRVPYDLKRTLAIYERSGFARAGGVTARLLRLELEHAAPFLVPFIHWAAAQALPRHAALIDRFLAFYDPNRPIHELFRRLGEGSRRPR